MTGENTVGIIPFTCFHLSLPAVPWPNYGLTLEEVATTTEGSGKLLVSMCLRTLRIEC